MTKKDEKILDAIIHETRGYKMNENKIGYIEYGDYTLFCNDFMIVCMYNDDVGNFKWIKGEFADLMIKFFEKMSKETETYEDKVELDIAEIKEHKKKFGIKVPFIIRQSDCNHDTNAFCSQYLLWCMELLKENSVYVGKSWHDIIKIIGDKGCAFILPMNPNKYIDD